MRRLASICLGSGLLLIALVLGLALTTVTRTSVTAYAIPETTNDSCLFCHEDVHKTWDVVTAAPVTAPGMPTPTPVPGTITQMCSDCHEMDYQVELPDAAIENQIAGVQARVDDLQFAVGSIFALHPEWDANVYRHEKTNAQIVAERVETLLAVIQADGSWGFHDPEYTEEILSEAEDLLASLLADQTN